METRKFKNNNRDCQCCFKSLAENEESMKINDVIEQWYFDLTQLEVYD